VADEVREKRDRMTLSLAGSDCVAGAQSVTCARGHSGSPPRLRPALSPLTRLEEAGQRDPRDCVMRRARVRSAFQVFARCRSGSASGLTS